MWTFEKIILYFIYEKFLLLFIDFPAVYAFVSQAQSDILSTRPEKLTIGIFETPPFVMEKKNGDLSGMSISSWEMVNKKLKYDYTYKPYESLSALLDAVKSGEVDFSINPVTVTDQRIQEVDFSQPYFISHTGIAKRKGNPTWAFIKNLWSWKFVSAVFILVAIIFIFGSLVWLFERKKNAEEFGNGLHGLKEGFWWGAVTMTTVGYGDRSPQTTGGRIVGFIWMFAAVIMISSLTAGIASALTVQSINDEISSVEDLDKFDVVTVKGSSAQELLNLYQIDADAVFDEKEGMRNLIDKKVDVFVYDQPNLNYEIERLDLGDDVKILQKTLKRDYYSYSFPKESVLLRKINPALVSTMETLEWSKLQAKYQ